MKIQHGDEEKQQQPVMLFNKHNAAFHHIPLLSSCYPRMLLKPAVRCQIAAHAFQGPNWKQTLCSCKLPPDLPSQGLPAWGVPWGIHPPCWEHHPTLQLSPRALAWFFEPRFSHGEQDAKKKIKSSIQLPLLTLIPPLVFREHRTKTNMLRYRLKLVFLMNDDILTREAISYVFFSCHR